MTILALAEVAWAVAGSTLGLTIIATALAVHHGRSRQRSTKNRADLWRDLTRALETLHTEPDDVDAQATVRDTLASPEHRTRALKVVATVTSLQRHDADLTDALASAGIADSLEAAMCGDDPNATRAALTIVGRIRSRECLPVVLMRCDDDSPEIRRIASQTLGRLAPASAIEMLLASHINASPWRTELLADLLAGEGRAAWFDLIGLAGDTTPRPLVDLVNTLTAAAADSSTQRQRAAVDALASLDHRLGDQALRMISTGPEEVAASAARAALGIADPIAEPPQAQKRGSKYGAASLTSASLADLGLETGAAAPETIEVR